MQKNVFLNGTAEKTYRAKIKWLTHLCSLELLLDYRQIILKQLPNCNIGSFSPENKSKCWGAVPRYPTGGPQSVLTTRIAEIRQRNVWGQSPIAQIRRKCPQIAEIRRKYPQIADIRKRYPLIPIIPAGRREYIDGRTFAQLEAS